MDAFMRGTAVGTLITVAVLGPNMLGNSANVRWTAIGIAALVGIVSLAFDPRPR